MSKRIYNANSNDEEITSLCDFFNIAMICCDNNSHIISHNDSFKNFFPNWKNLCQRIKHSDLLKHHTACSLLETHAGMKLICWHLYQTVEGKHWITLKFEALDLLENLSQYMHSNILGLGDTKQKNTCNKLEQYHQFKSLQLDI